MHTQRVTLPPSNRNLNAGHWGSQHTHTHVNRVCVLPNCRGLFLIYGNERGGDAHLVRVWPQVSDGRLANYWKPQQQSWALAFNCFKFLYNEKTFEFYSFRLSAFDWRLVIFKGLAQK